MNKFLFASVIAFAMARGVGAIEQSLAFPAGVPLEVTILTGSGKPIRSSVEPTDTRYKQMQQWLANNQGGWSAYLATPPGRGTLVSAGGLTLQFVEGNALACVAGSACRSKRVKAAEYGFLVK